MKKQNTPILVRRGEEYCHYNMDIAHKEFKDGTNLHWHDHYEMEIVTGGSGTYFVNGMQYPLKRGSVYLVTPVDFHQIRGDFTIYNITFNDAMVSSEVMNLIIAGNCATVVNFEEEEFTFWETVLSRLLSEFHGESPLKNQAERALLEAILIGFLRRIDISFSDQGRSDVAVMRVVAYIKFNFKKKLTLSEVAKAVHLTPNYVGEIFAKKMGVSFNQYLMQTRLNYAKNLLLRGGMSVQEVAAESGFGSQTYFSDCFRREFGFTPSDTKNMTPFVDDPK